MDGPPGLPGAPVSNTEYHKLTVWLNVCWLNHN